MSSAAGGATSIERPDIVDARALARIANLTLRARLVVEGLLTGLHRSPHHGSSVEFAEHKEYSPGDDARHIDWKLYAKSDRYTVKRFEEETNLRATFFIDGSGSMAYASGELSKWDYSLTLAASLAYLLLKQGDAIGTALAAGGRESYLPARSDSAHFRALLETLGRFEPGGPTDLEGALDVLANRLRRRGLVIVLSDGLTDLASTVRALGHLRQRRHEVVLFQVLDPFELEFPFDGLTLFESMEDDRELLSDATAVRAEYLRRLTEHNQALARACRAHEIDHIRVSTGSPVIDALVGYLGSRR